METNEIHQNALEIGEKVSDQIQQWGYFSKNSVGIKLLMAADSIAAFIACGLGRREPKMIRIEFLHARGAIFETKTWLIKAHQRHLIGKEEYEDLALQVKLLNRLLNHLLQENEVELS